jgi:hypothetical protein
MPIKLTNLLYSVIKSLILSAELYFSKNILAFPASVAKSVMKHADGRYMSGLKYLSSLQRYKNQDIEGLKEKVREFHPLG